MRDIARAVSLRYREHDQLTLLRSAVEHTTDHVFITNVAGTITYANPAFALSTGYTQAELVGETPAILRSGRHDSAFFQTLWETVLAGNEFRAVVTNRKKSGEVYDVAKVICPIRDVHGVITHFVSTGRDVTDQRRAEKEMRLLQSVTWDMGQARDFLSGVAIVLGKVCEATGWDYGEAWTPAADGSHLVACGLWHRGSPELVEFAALSEGTTFALGQGLPGRVWKEGTSKWIGDTSTLSPARFPRAREAGRLGLKSGCGVPIIGGGETLAVLCFFVSEHQPDDRNELKVVAAVASQLSALLLRCRAEEDLRRSEVLLMESRKLESVGRLASGIAHDFNNLLTVIQGFAGLAHESLPAGSEEHSELDEVLAASRRASNLTRQILTFARKQRVEPRVIEVNETIAGVLSMLQRLLGAHAQAVFLPSAKASYVRVDPGQFEQLLMNLGVNARDAMPAGGTVTFATRRATIGQNNLELERGPFVELTVTDTGAGMGAEVLAHIFEPFFTTKEVGEGTGLGLATSYGIVQQAGGSISAESTPGKGTTFRILLPRVAEEATHPEGPLQPALNGSGETVLLAEDDPQVRQFAARALRRAGYEVVEATNGSEALTIAGEHKGEIDLLLTDITMPLMRGDELAERLRQLRPTTKVLLASGYAEGLPVQGGDVMPFLAKPFTVHSLIAKVHEVLHSDSG